MFIMKKVFRIAFLFICVLYAGCTRGICSTNELKTDTLIGKNSQINANTIYIYIIKNSHTAASYDEAMAVACIQGILNRDKPCIYVQSSSTNKTQLWLDIFSKDGRWLSGKKKVYVSSFDELMGLSLSKVKGIIIWDPDVPASVNVATTLAGISDGIVFSPEMAEKYKNKYGLKVLKDFRGQFTGKETGSKKNDAYRWAIREYMDKGLCNPHRMCLNDDSYFTRKNGDLSYIVTRDWAVYGKCFVYDLSPWGDEKPKDDLNQPLGTDLETYKLLLQSLLNQTKGKTTTEVAGFFSFQKYSNVEGYASQHDPVPTEWENVYLISPYNCYQNTVASGCFNQSFHSQAPQKSMKQEHHNLGSPKEGKTYIAILMADYDSTTPLYEFMMNNIWNDPKRGNIPLLWGINPNLCETYPDIMQYIYSTRSSNDWFGADASCAGYFNPNRINNENMPLFIEHNKKFYEQWDMTISPMVLDTNEPSKAVKDAFSQFSPDGFATIVMNFHKGMESRSPDPQVWKGMPIMNLNNSACNDGSDPEKVAFNMSNSIPKTSDTTPRYYFFRIIWVGPSKVIEAVKRLKELRPDLDIEVLDPYNFFHYFKTTLNK
jgi:hypothetical protein